MVSAENFAERGVFSAIGSGEKLPVVITPIETNVTKSFAKGSFGLVENGGVGELGIFSLISSLSIVSASWLRKNALGVPSHLFQSC